MSWKVKSVTWQHKTGLRVVCCHYAHARITCYSEFGDFRSSGTTLTEALTSMVAWLEVNLDRYYVGGYPPSEEAYKKDLEHAHDAVKSAIGSIFSDWVIGITSLVNPEKGLELRLINGVWHLTAHATPIGETARPHAVAKLYWNFIADSHKNLKSVLRDSQTWRDAEYAADRYWNSLHTTRPKHMMLPRETSAH